MAFGKFMKDLVDKAKNLFGKVGNAIRNAKPIIDKGIEIGRKVVDTAGKVTEGIGGKFGTTVRGVLDSAKKGMDFIEKANGGVQKYLKGGEGGSRFLGPQFATED